MLTKRKLTNWRKEALSRLAFVKSTVPQRMNSINPAVIANERILKLTQELIDRHLINELKKEEKAKNDNQKTKSD